MLSPRLPSLLVLILFITFLFLYAFSSKTVSASTGGGAAAAAAALDTFSQALAGFTTSNAPRTTLPLSPTVNRIFDQVWSPHPSTIEYDELSAACARGSFDKDIYLRCKAPYAGLTTIMSQLKTCVRLAVDTGNHLVIPTIAQRDDSDLKEFNKDNSRLHKSFGEWFDEETFLARLNRACPRMKVVRLDENRDPMLSVSQHIQMNLTTAPYFNGVGNWAWPGRDWVAWYNAEMERFIAQSTTDGTAGSSSSSTKDVTRRGNTLVEAFAPLSFFNIMGDISGRSLRMWNEMNGLLRFKETQRNIVNSILSSPLMMVNGQNAENSNDNNVNKGGQIKPFYGVHFRTEKDSPDVWIKADVQIARILDKAEEAWALDRHGRDVEKVIYLACGDTDRIAQFEEAAGARGWQVIDKYRLAASISATLHQDLLDLPFDHQGMIDLGIMMVSEFFFGLTNSAFSFSIAHARDPRGRFAGSTLLHPFDEVSRIARTHLFDDGEGAYQCCL